MTSRAAARSGAEPADTSMMGVVHGALRRDLARVRMVVVAGDVEPERRRTLGQHVTWLVDFLHHHHAGEDAGLFPLARSKDPSLGGLLDSMDAEHEAILPAMEAVEVAARGFASDPEAGPTLLAALDRLEGVLEPHLVHEERELMPRVAAVVTRAEWDTWDQETNVKSKRPGRLAFEGHWLIDNAGPEDRERVVRLVPPVPRFVLLRLWGGPYRRRRRRLWAGTPAVEVPLLTLDELAATPRPDRDRHSA